jgi:ribosomal protein L11 methylase PrmA
LTTHADPGSFRDPTSRVYLGEDAVWRGLTADALADYDALAATRFYRAALERGDLVATERVDHAPVDGDWAAVLRHERIGVISYPYEWPFEMLRVAARLQLALTRDALAEKLITKDASSYNVQFVGTKPVFIDVGSFERLRSGEPWAGYRQFCELYLNPLLLQAILDVPFQPWLRGDVHGIPPTVAASVLKGHGRLDKAVLVHVKLHARAERKYADADRDALKSEMQRAGMGPGLIDAQLKNLQRTVDELTWDQQSSTWSDYSDRSHYTDRDLEAKETFVADAIGAAGSPGLVLDLGANDGRFSRVAVRAGARFVVAVDSDALVIDRLYRDLVTEGEPRVLPLVLDLANPSPGVGWRSRERPPFVERVRPDLVLCLAVVHHLALTDNVPLDDVVGFLAEFGAPLVVEFPHRDDPMVVKLLARKRSGLFDAYDRANWETALSTRFTVRRSETLPGGTRTLYDCELR